MKDFSHAWQNSVLSQLLFDYKFIEEDNRRILLVSLDEVSDELRDLGHITSFLFDSVYSSGDERARINNLSSQ